MTGRISVFLYNSRFSFIKALVAAAFAILLVCGFNGAASGQGEGAIQAIVEKSSYAGAKAGTSSEGQGQARSSNPPRAAKAAVPKPTTRTTVRSTSPGQAGKYNGSIIGDKYSFLNFEIASKVQPVWTIAAQNAHAAGLVQVEVLIDQNGRVLTAHARTGNALLHPEAEKAALAAVFNQPTVNGRPARALGFVVYRFGREEDASYEDGGPPPQDPNEPIPEYVHDGLINSQAISLPKPDYVAKDGYGGMVYVEITVDEKGNVISAQSSSKEPLVRAAVEKAAKQAKFKPRLVRGHPVKVMAGLQYLLEPKK